MSQGLGDSHLDGVGAPGDEGVEVAQQTQHVVTVGQRDGRDEVGEEVQVTEEQRRRALVAARAGCGFSRVLHTRHESATTSGCWCTGQQGGSRDGTQATGKASRGEGVEGEGTYS